MTKKGASIKQFNDSISRFCPIFCALKPYDIKQSLRELIPIIFNIELTHSG